MTEELAWAAGLFDGEGTIGVRKNGTTEAYRRIGASVGMTERFVVERFAKAVGIGKFYDHLKRPLLQREAGSLGPSRKCR